MYNVQVVGCVRYIVFPGTLSDRFTFGTSTTSDVWPYNCHSTIRGRLDHCCCPRVRGAEYWKPINRFVNLVPTTSQTEKRMSLPPPQISQRSMERNLEMPNSRLREFQNPFQYLVRKHLYLLRNHRHMTVPQEFSNNRSMFWPWFATLTCLEQALISLTVSAEKGLEDPALTTSSCRN